MSILNILNEINPHVNWRSKWRKIQRAMENYDSLSERDRPRGEGTILQPILPEYWEFFHTHNIHRIRNGKLPKQEDDFECLPLYDVGIFLVGYSSLPIVLSLAEIQPAQEIYFFYSSGTDGTQDRCFEIADRMRAMLTGLADFDDLIDRVDNSVCDLNKFGLEVDNPSDPVETFKRIKEVIDSIDAADNKRIALDLTGGKKTMIGGGFTAGSILDFSDSIDMFYIDSLEYDQHRGYPKPGTEFLSQLENPYNVYNVQTLQEAKKLFNAHNYDASVQLWEEAAKKLKTPVRGSKSPVEQYSLKDEQKVVQSDLSMASCYRLWDAFDYQKAKDCKSFSFYDPDAKRSFGHSWGYNNKHVHGSIDVLDILSEVENKESLFACDARVIHYAVDRYQNGRRRMESGKFEDALVRFTQVVEMLSNYEIYQIASNEGLVNQSGNTVNNITPNTQWRNFKLIPFLFGTNSRYERNYNRYYEFSDSSVCLQICDYPPLEHVCELSHLIEYRNEFIHFGSPMEHRQTGENACKLKNVARKFLENFSRDYCIGINLSFDEFIELHEFHR